MIIVPVNYLVLIFFSNRQEVAFLEPLVDWWVLRCSEIISTILREMLNGGFKNPIAGCLKIEAIDMIVEGTEVVLPPNVHFVAGYVKNLHQI
jgi:hypothetical protein